jgi:hypothetical protein
MMLRRVSDFIVPTLSVLDAMGGEANPNDFEDVFYKRYASVLDPAIDWNKTTPNHNKALWRDYCGGRVAFRYLKPEGYIVVESHGLEGRLGS